LGCLENDVVSLYGSVTFGSTGAVASSTGKGITSVTRNSAGKYTVLLQDTYNAFLWADCKILNATLSDPSSVGVFADLFSQAVATTTPTVVFQFVATDDGAAADPASGAVAYFKIDLRNSSAT
jgi:hypothetical protein